MYLAYWPYISAYTWPTGPITLIHLAYRPKQDIIFGLPAHIINIFWPTGPNNMVRLAFQPEQVIENFGLPAQPIYILGLLAQDQINIFGPLAYIYGSSA